MLPANSSYIAVYYLKHKDYETSHTAVECTKCDHFASLNISNLSQNIFN